MTKEKLKVTTDTKGRAKVNKKPANQKKQTNVINNDGEGQMIENSIAKKPKVDSLLSPIPILLLLLCLSYNSMDCVSSFLQVNCYRLQSHRFFTYLEQQ